jgi:hypothetical protein
MHLEEAGASNSNLVDLKNASDSSLPGLHHEKLDVNRPEKLKLLQRLVVRKRVKVDCRLDFSFDQLCIFLSGSKSCVDSCLSFLLEVMLTFESGTANLSKGIVSLLARPDGERWLNERLDEHDLLAVIFVRKSTSYVLGADETALNDTIDMLQRLFTVEEVKFNEHHVEFLQSTKWLETVAMLERNRLLTLTTSHEQGQIVIEGCAEDVKKTFNEVYATLRTENRADGSLQLTPNSYKVVSYYRQDIEHQLQTRLEIN